MSERSSQASALSPYLTVKGAAAAIDFYRAAFGAVEQFRLTGPDGRIGHAELKIAGATVMLSDEWPDFGALSPPSVGGSPVKLHLYVDDCDAVVARAVAAGATLMRPVHGPVLWRPQRHDGGPVRSQLVRRDAEGAGDTAGDAAPLGRGNGRHRLSRLRPPREPVGRRGAAGGAGRAGSSPTAARSSRPSRSALLRQIARLGLLQIDSVSAVVRSHYLPLFSRLGAYQRDSSTAWPMRAGGGGCSSTGATRRRCCRSAQPLLRWRMARARAGRGIYGGLATFARERAGYSTRCWRRSARGAAGRGRARRGRQRPGRLVGLE